MLNKTQAIVLHHIRYGDTSLIVTLYTEKFGRLTCMVSGVHSKRSKFPPTYFQPLTLLEGEIYYKRNREIQRIRELACPFHYTTIPFTIVKSSIALFLAEVLYITLREEEANPALFSFLFHSFQLLDTREEGIPNFHLLFMLNFSKYLGIFPAELAHRENSAELSVFSHMPDEAWQALTNMAGTSLAAPEKVDISHHTRNLLLDRLMRYFSLHMDGMDRMKSLQVLKEVFR
jgi:DNA repair protein RecO (recombination protein O)